MGTLLRICYSSPYSLSFVVFLVFTAGAFLIDFAFNLLRKLILKRTLTELDDKLFKYLSRGFFFSIITIGLYLALYAFYPLLGIKEEAEKVFLTFGALFWGLLVIKGGFSILKVVEKECKEKREEIKGALPFFKNTLGVTVGIIICLLILNVWGASIAPLLASAGVVGVAVAFAAKDTMANLFGGLSAFFDKPYKIGDYVIIDKEYRGEVIEIGMRSTKIKTRDSVLLTVPNSVMVTGVVVNQTGQDGNLRVRIPVGVSYEADLEKAEKILMEVMNEDERLVKREAPPRSPVVRYRTFSPSTIDLEAMCLLERPSLKGVVVHSLIKKIKKRFEEEGIEMPPPTRKVYLSK